MSIRIQCPSCGTGYKIPDKLAGKTVKCKTCGKAIKVSAAPGADDLVSPDELQEIDSGPSPALQVPLPPPPTRGPPPLPADGPYPQGFELAIQSRPPRGKLFLILGAAGAGLVALILVCLLGSWILGAMHRSAGPAATPDRIVAPSSDSNQPRDVGPVLPENPRTSMVAPQGPPPPPPRPEPAALPPADAAGAVATAAPVPRVWQVQPDPGPSLKIAANMVAAAPTSGQRDLIFAEPPGRFIASYGKGFGEGLELWDLQSGQKTREIAKGRVELTRLLISPDGLYLAGTRAALNLAMASVEVYSFRDLTIPVQRIAGKAPDAANIHALEFLAPDRMLVVTEAPERRFQLYKIGVSKPLADYPAPAPAAGAVTAFSPGGKYLAVVVAGKLTVMDVVTGNVVGDVDVVDRTPPDAPVGIRERTHSAEALAFSADGTRLAALFRDLQHTRIVTWDMARGHALTDATANVRSSLGGVGTALLAWLPDNSALLCEGAYLDAQTLTSLGPPLENIRAGCFRMVDGDRLLMVTPAPAQMNFSLVPLPRDAMTQTLAAIAATNAAEQLKPRDLQAADRAGMRTVDLWSKPPAWSLTPPPPAAPGALVDHLNLLTPGERDVAPERIGRILLSSRATPVAAVQDLVEKGGAARGTVRMTMLRYDLASGALTARSAMPRALDPVDLSPAGNQILAVGGPDCDRLDVLAFGDPLMAATAAWLPFEGASGALGHSIYWAAFADETRILAMNGEGLVTCWEIATRKALWSAQGRSGWRRPVLSADRQYLAIAGESQIALVDPVSAKVLGTLAIPANAQYDWSGVFSSDATQLAAVFMVGDRPLLTAYDLRSGTASVEMPLPLAREARLGPRAADRGERLPPLQFTASDFLLAGTTLISLEKRAPVWSYVGAASEHATPLFGPVCPFNRVYRTISQSFPPKTDLLGFDLPHEEARGAARAAPSDGWCAWRPGARVKLDISVVGDEAYHDQAVRDWTAALTTAGYTVDPGAACTIRAANSVAVTDQKQYAVHMPREGSFTVCSYARSTSISLQVNGETLWSTESRIPGSPLPPSVMLVTQPGETDQAAADRAYPSPKNFHRIILPPPYAFRQTPISASSFTDKGLQFAGSAVLR